MFIGGQSVSTARRYEIRLPYDNTVVAHVAEGDAGSLGRAMDAAVAGARAMAALTNAERCDLLFRVRDLIRRDAAEFAELLSLETGKPIRESRFEVERAQQTLISAAIAARELCGEAIPIDAAPIGKGRMAMTVREPLGVIGAITPFNVPLNLALHKVAPALAGGNAVVHKPSELTPLTAIRLAGLFAEAGAPAGAYNVVTGDGAVVGQALVAHPAVRMITFTGSVEVGTAIRAKAGLKRVTLELGGNSPILIEPDADLELAVERAVQGAFSNSGQVCLSVQRILVHEDVAERFTNRFVRAAQNLRIGHPLEEATDISSLISETEAQRVGEWVADAVDRGAKALTATTRHGATLTPTVLADVPPDARMSCQEIFGPVVGINKYNDLERAITEANGTPYGLQAGVFTRDIGKAFAVARKLEFGGVLINDIPAFRADHMPYGGVKNSGLGREGPRYAIEEMTETKLICWR
jgi:acyl-CoA reductase-like NAD-dependent aldehyde dehydrogenase